MAEDKINPLKKAKLLIEEVKFSLMISDKKKQLLIAIRIQRERLETLTEFGIISDYEREVASCLLILNP
jgi:hypothetical protein